MSGYLRHIELSRQLEEKAREASRTRQLAEERLSELQALFQVAQRHDCKLGEAEDLISQAKSAIAAKDYRLALEKTKDGEDKVRAAFLQRVQSILDSSESMLGLLGRTDEDTTEYEALMSSARDALDKGNFEEAVETAKRGWTKGEKMLHEYLSKSFSTTQSLILAAKAMEKDTAVSEDLLAKARTALEASDYDEALSQTEEALDLLGRELDFELVEERKTVDQLMEAGKALEANLSKAENYLGRFDKELEKADYEKAFNLLKQARVEAERQLKKRMEAGGINLETPIEEAKKLGVDTSTAEGLSKEIVRAADEGDYTTAAQLLRRGVQELESAKFQKVLQTISISRPKFLQARDMGADVKGAVDIFSKARQSLQDGDFKDALYRAEKGNEVLDELIQTFRSSRERMEALSQEITSFSEYGLDLSEVEGLLRTAEEELVQGNLKSWSSVVSRIEKSLESARSGRLEQVIAEAQFQLTLAEKTGLSLAEEKESLQVLSKALKTGGVNEALQDALRLKDGLQKRITSHVRGRLDDLKGTLPKDELDQVSELADKAQTALDVQDLETALRMVEEAHAKAEGRVKERSAAILEGMKAAQQLSSDHDLETYGLREAYLAAKTGLDEGNFASIYKQFEATKEQLVGLSKKAFDLVKARVIEARDAGIEIGQMKNSLVDAKSAIDRGDVIKGLVSLRDSSLGAKQSLDLYQKVHHVTAAAAALIAEGKKKNVDMTRSLELLIKGKTAFEGGDLERALEFARSARAEAEKEISVLNVTDRVMSARETLDLARVLEVDVSVWRNLLQRSQQSLDAGDFREAVELAMETEEQARGSIRDKINSMTAKAEGQLDKVQVPAKEVDDLQESISTAKTLLNDKKLREAAQLMQNTLGGCEELVTAYEGVLDVLKNADVLASELRSMNVKTSGPEKLLSKANKAYGEGNLRHARQLGEEAHTQLERQGAESIERTLKSFEATVARARESGINTSTAEDMLQVARSLLEGGKYNDALSTAMQSETEVEKMGLQKEIAENALESARTRISSLPRPVAFITDMLKEAERAFEAGDYVSCLEAAVRAGDEFSKIIYAWEELERSEEAALSFYKTAEIAALDMSRLQALLAEAKQATDRGDLDMARESYDELATQAAQLTSSYVTQLHTEVRNAMVLCSLLNCEVEGIDDKLSQGRSYADESRFDNAIDILTRAQGETHMALRSRLDELLAESLAAADHADRVGVDTKKARGMVEEARATIEEGNFERAVRLAQESLEAIQSKEEFHQEFMGSSLKAESLIKTAKKFGIDVKAANKSLQQAFKMKDGDPSGALKRAREALELVENALEAFSPSLDGDLNLQVATKDVWHDATVRLQNTGKALAKDLEVEVMGNMEVRDLQAPPSIRARGDGEIRFQIMFRSLGQVPVMVKAKVKRVLDDQEYEWEKVFNVSVGTVADESETAEDEGEPQDIVAEYDSKCSLCRGTIGKGFTAKKCVCGALLHEPCASRAGRCPACQRLL